MSQAGAVRVTGFGNVGMTTVSQRFGAGWKRAPTRTSARSETLQDAPLHGEVHDEKASPAAGVAVSAIEVPSSNAAEHVPGQTMPAGIEVTIPAPSISRVS